MMKKLPKDGYKWSEFSNIDELIGNYRSKTDFGHFVEIDLQYPREVHNDHSDFPLDHEKHFIKDDWLSAFSKNSAVNRYVVPKLVKTLFDKPNYICHIENLLFYIDQGLKVGISARSWKYRSKTDFGHFVETDLEYPREVHNDHSDFPLDHEKHVIKDDWLSAYSKNSAVNRLSASLYRKKYGYA